MVSRVVRDYRLWLSEPSGWCKFYGINFNWYEKQTKLHETDPGFT